jgi:hypothetical protein
MLPSRSPRFVSRRPADNFCPEFGFLAWTANDRDTRDRLIREHKTSASILKPILRGRDVKRWRTEFAEQYVNISRGRRGVRIFTLDKEQFRKNVARSGHRTLALELVDDFVPPWRPVLGLAS